MDIQWYFVNKEGLLVGSGAALGALARWAVALAIGAGLWPILAINALGSAVMGFAAPGPYWGKGFLGGFTTFSTFAILTMRQSPAMAAIYVVVTLVSCVAAYLIGDWARRRA